MRGRVAAALAGLLLAGCATTPPPASPAPYTDLSQAFLAFYDRTTHLDEAARVAAFRAEIVPLFPGFYSTRGRASEEQYDAAIARNLARFGEVRERYVAVQRSFPEAYAKARAHFRQHFPESTATLPTYLLYSLNEMDGGTREIDGRTVMIFGADGIAQYHTPETMGPFFDHELFHVEHGAYFPECEAIWCALWTEGLATAAAEQMNPDVSDAALMLTIPRPIRSEIDADWRKALCALGAKLDATDSSAYRGLFTGDGADQTYPPRWGYYVGYRLAKRLLERNSLQDLAHLDGTAAEPHVRGELAAMQQEAGGCAS